MTSKWPIQFPAHVRARLFVAGFSWDEAVEANRVWVDKWRHGRHRVNEYTERCVRHYIRLRSEGKHPDPGQVGAEIRRRMRLK